MAGLLTCRPVSNAFPLTSTIVRHFIITDWSYMNFQWLLFDPFIRGSSQQRDCPGFPPDSLLITREGKPLAIYFAKICLFYFLSKSMLTFISSDYVPVLLQ